VDQYIEPGDLILTQTPSAMFGIFRDMGHTQYDHVVAVIDKERSLHISYPYAKLVPTILFVQDKKRPLVLKNKMEKLQKDNFIQSIKHNLVGKSYDYKRVIHFFIFSKLAEVSNINYRYVDRDDKVVCTHHITKEIMKISPSVKREIQQSAILNEEIGEHYDDYQDFDFDSVPKAGLLDFQKLGTFSINDILQLKMLNYSIFQQLHLFQDTVQPVERDSKLSLGDRILDQFIKMFPDE
jgi:hypothetical protein